MALWLLFFSLRPILSSISCSLKQSNHLLSKGEMSREKKLNKDRNPPTPLEMWRLIIGIFLRLTENTSSYSSQESFGKLPMGQRDFTDFTCLFSLNGWVPSQYIVVLIEMFISLAARDTAFRYPENRWTHHWNYFKVVVISGSYVLNFLLNQSICKVENFYLTSGNI